MDFFDAVNDIRKRFPDVPEDEIRRAMDLEIDAITGDMKRANYAEAVETAHNRINGWLESGHENRVNVLNLDSVCHLLTTHRPAAAWATLRSIWMKQTKNDVWTQAKASFPCSKCGAGFLASYRDIWSGHTTCRACEVQ